MPSGIGCQSYCVSACQMSLPLPPWIEGGGTVHRMGPRCSCSRLRRSTGRIRQCAVTVRASQVVAAADGIGHAGNVGDEVRLRCPGRERRGCRPARTRSEPAAPLRTRRAPRRTLSPANRRRTERSVSTPQIVDAEHRRDGVERCERRDLLGDVELQELDVAAEHRRAQRLGVQAVHQRHVDVRRAGELVEHRREVATGLLVLPRAGEEHRHLDPVDERDRRERVAERRRVVRVVVDLLRRDRGSAAAASGCRRTSCRRRRHGPWSTPDRTASTRPSAPAVHVTAKPVLRMPPGYSVAR